MLADCRILKVWESITSIGVAYRLKVAGITLFGLDALTNIGQNFKIWDANSLTNISSLII